MSRIIIAVENSRRSEDAIAFGGALARHSGAAVTVANAYASYLLPIPGTAEANQFLLRESKQLMRRMSLSLRDLPGFEMRALSGTSPAQGLQELADEQGASLIVVGSSRSGRVGRILPGSTAERLLHGSPCAVAVVPQGYRAAGPHAINVVACGWGEGPESDAALAAAQGLAEAMSASLRVIRVVEPREYPALPPVLGVAHRQYDQEARTRAELALERRVGDLPARLAASGEMRVGPAAKTLVEVSEAVDLLVLGSRGYGPIRAVLLGGVSGKIVCAAACPVIVVPSGSHEAVASMFGAHALTAAG